MPSRVRAGNLTAALLLVSLLELVVNRMAGRLFLPRTTISGVRHGSSLGRLLGDSGPFLYHLTGVLGLFVLLAAVVGLMRRGELFPKPVRFVVALIGEVFWVLAALGVTLGRLEPQFFVALAIAFGFLNLLVLMSAIGALPAVRTKVGMGLLILPALLHVVALVDERSGWSRGGVTPLTGAAEIAMLASAIAAPFFWDLRRLGGRPWRLPLLVATSLTALFTVLLVVRLDLLQAAALFSLHIDLPALWSTAGVAHVVGLFGWTFAVTQLLLGSSAARLVAYGLVMVAIGGPQATSPIELAVSLVGLLAVTVGELRALDLPGPRRAQQAPGDWRTYVGRVAGAASDRSSPDGLPPEAVVVTEDDLEVSRIRGFRRGRPVGVRFLRRRGRVVEYEAVVGEPGRANPDATIERHRSWLARSPEQRLPLPRARTGDATFDQKFSVHGKAPLGDEALRRRFAGQGAGVLSLWAGAAARYRALSSGDQSPGEVDAALTGSWQGDEPVQAVLADLDRLADLIEAS